MERFYGENEEQNYNTRVARNSNKIDLTLKLSPCGENSEEIKMTKSSSSSSSSSSSVAGKTGNINVSNGSHFGPFVPSLERSCSLPTMLLERQRSVVALKLQGPRHAAEGGIDSNFHISTKNKEDSMIMQETIAMEVPIPPRSADTKLEKPAKKLNLPNYCSLKGDVMEILRQMPTVTTIGDGPNGRRIEGFLYKYRSGQVCIVCVCHGSFLTPAEFVMHAGGKEVANPMKHITVHPISF